MVPAKSGHTYARTNKLAPEPGSDKLYPNQASGGGGMT